MNEPARMINMDTSSFSDEIKRARWIKIEIITDSIIANDFYDSFSHKERLKTARSIVKKLYEYYRDK